MATLSRGQSFGATETITNTKLHNLVDLGSVTGIVDADISPGAAIQFSKLLASAIDVSLLVNIPNAAVAAGKWPFANLPVPFGSTYVSLVSIPNSSLLPLTLASWVDGISLRNLASTPIDQQIRYNLLVSSIASGGIPKYNGINNFVGGSIDNLSNCLFQYNGCIDGTAGSSGIGEVVGGTLTPAYEAPTTTFRFLVSDERNIGSGAGTAVWTTKWTKIPGINTITVYARLWIAVTTLNGVTKITVNVGGQTGTVSATAGSTTPTWYNFTINVSGLSNGNVYDVTASLGIFNDVTQEACCSNIVAFGS